MAKQSTARVQTEPVPEGEKRANVIETAPGRESLTGRMDDLLESQQAVVNQIDQITRERREDREILNTLTALVERFDARMEELETRPVQPVVTKTEHMVEHAKETVKENVTKAKDEAESLTRRAGNRMRHPVQTAKDIRRGTRREHFTGLLIGNVLEYGALVGIAQMAPVATLNIISTALFI